MQSSAPQRGLFPIISKQKAVLVGFLDITEELVFNMCVYIRSPPNVVCEKLPGKLHKSGSHCVLVSACFTDVMQRGISVYAIHFSLYCEDSVSL
jgi:hypothetical protein